MSDEETAAAFERLRTVLEVAPKGVFVRTAALPAAAHARATARRDLLAPRVERFQRFADTGFWSMSSLHALRDLADATWHCGRMQASAAGAKRKIPHSLACSAQEVRRRMLKVLEYHFEDDERVRLLPSGPGAVDLANDLQQLARLYEDPYILPVIQADQRFFDGGDIATARHLAKALAKHLGIEPASSVDDWAGLTRAALNLLLESYDEVAAAGRFLFRKDEDVSETYPSLIAAGRRPRRRREEPEEEEEPRAKAQDGVRKLTPRPSGSGEDDVMTSPSGRGL